jgi:hypothetical protein
MRLPGFNAAASLGAAAHDYQSIAPSGKRQSDRQRVVAQLRFGGDPDIGEYLRCKANGGGELVCRFFAGLPPWTIGGVLF